MTEIKKIAGVVWYRSEEYESILTIMEDAFKLPRDYPIWRMQAEAGEKKAHRMGFSTVRAFIDPNTFPAWCHARGYNVDSKARNEFANLIAKEAANNI